MKPSSKFTITIPVKSYVRRYLELNFGLPVDFAYHPILHNMFHELLSKDSDFKHAGAQLRLYQLTDSVEVLITERDFYKYGWELSKISIIRFSAHFEEKAKLLMRTVVGTYSAIGVPIHLSLKRFQDKYGYSEDHWPFENMRKDFYRNGSKEKLDFETEIFLKVDKILLQSLSAAGH